MRHAIRKVLPKLGQRRVKTSLLHEGEVLYLQFEPPLDDTDHLFVVIEVDKEVERRQGTSVANDNGLGLPASRRTNS